MLLLEFSVLEQGTKTAELTQGWTSILPQKFCHILGLCQEERVCVCVHLSICLSFRLGDEVGVGHKVGIWGIQLRSSGRMYVLLTAEPPVCLHV